MSPKLKRVLPLMLIGSESRSGDFVIRERVGVAVGTGWTCRETGAVFRRASRCCEVVATPALERKRVSATHGTPIRTGFGTTSRVAGAGSLTVALALAERRILAALYRCGGC